MVILGERLLALDLIPFYKSLLDSRSYMSDTLFYDRERVHSQNQNLGRKRGVKVAFVPERGKGSHGTLYYGEKLTIVRNPKDALKTGTLHAMLAQLGLTLREL